MARSIKKTPAKKKSVKPTAKKTASKKPVAKKKAIPKKKTTASTARKKASAAATRTTPRSSQKKTARKITTKKNNVPAASKDKIKKSIPEITPGVSNQTLPPVEEKSLNVAPDMKFAPGMDRRSQLKAANRNYGVPNSGISNVKKGGIKPTGKKPLW
jgi:hypothetical protein